MSPGSNESAGRVKSSKTRPGNRYLKGVLGIAALSAARSRNTYFSAKYKRIAARRGPMPPIVPVEHAMVIAAWNLLTNGDFYRGPGAAYHTARESAATKARAVNQLQALGYASPSNRSPIPPNPPTPPVTGCGHLIFVSEPSRQGRAEGRTSCPPRVTMWPRDKPVRLTE